MYFIDESGDFGAFERHSPYYIVSMVVHNQKVDISEQISGLKYRLSNLGYPQHTVHTEPLIRRESVYSNDLTKILTLVFVALFSHVEFRKVRPVNYKLFQVADLMCTIEWLAQKDKERTLSKADLAFSKVLAISGRTT